MHDLSFQIHNDKGDCLTIALTYYDSALIASISDDPIFLSLRFCDVSLNRDAGNSVMTLSELSRVSEALVGFLDNNPSTVLCYYCSANEVRKRRNDIPPQLYRSILFLRMFESYVMQHGQCPYVIKTIKAEDPENPQLSQYAHFICRAEHQSVVGALSNFLMIK